MRPLIISAGGHVNDEHVSVRVGRVRVTKHLVVHVIYILLRLQASSAAFSLAGVQVSDCNVCLCMRVCARGGQEGTVRGRKKMGRFRSDTQQDVLALQLRPYGYAFEI